MAESEKRGLLEVGGKFGDYEVLKLLGSGGMGEVYLLRTPVDGEFYAAKIMFPPKEAEAHEWRTRFANEAAVAMKVQHKNLIRVYDIGEDPETKLCYIIMEYLGGGSLSEKIRKKGRLPVREAVDIAIQIAMALEAAHSAGIVHRDIKPDNIMFADDGTPKLGDLGVAKFDDGRKTTVTMTGVMIGTPAYMAPEQMMDSHNVDARADIYSLGAVLYEMLSGTRPHQGSTAMELLAKAVKGEELPNICELKPDIPETIGCVISRMTAPKVEKRIESALEAARMLRDAFVGKLKSGEAGQRVACAKVQSRKAVTIAKLVLNASLMVVFAAAVVALVAAIMYPDDSMAMLRNVAGIAPEDSGSSASDADSADVSSVVAIAPVRQPTDSHTEMKQEAERQASKNPRVDATAHAAPKATVVLVPRFDRSPDAWAHSFAEEKGWMQPGFDDSRWSRSGGGIGASGRQTRVRYAKLNARWVTKRLFLRRRFNWSGGDVSRVVADVFHDDGFRLYLNGKQILSARGWNNFWAPFEIDPGLFAGALVKGDNVLCAEVENDYGDQYFDCGLLVTCGGTPEPRAAPDGVRIVETPAGKWTVKVENGIARIGDGCGIALEPQPSGTLEIPSEIGGLRIKGIAPNSFKGCRLIKKVAVAEGIYAIGEEAFANCTGISEIVIPETLEYIGRAAFMATTLERINLKNVRILERGVFQSCRKMEEVAVNAENQSYRIKDGVLYDRTCRAVVFCPRSRTKYSFPRGVEAVFDYAFHQSSLKSVFIPDTVVHVGQGAFADCGKLESIVLPHALEEIGSGALSGCPVLRSAVFNGDACKVGNGLYKGSNPSLATFVRREAKGWTDFGGGLPRLWPVGDGDDSRQIRYVVGNTER